MARKYTPKEIRSVIDKHKENLKSLEASFLLPSKFEKQIKSCINNLYSACVFSTDVMDSLKGRESDQKAQIGELIKLLYLYKRVTRQFHICQAILSNNKEQIASLIKEASAGSGTITWFFASSKKKQNSEEAYEKLVKETDGSDYWRASKEVLSYIAENDNVTVTEGWNDFKVNVKEYQDILKENLPNNFRPSELIRDLDQLITEFKDTASDIEKETSKTNAIRDNIRNAAERMVMVTVLDILKTIPVEEINRNKKGFRIKALRDAGYTTVADLYTASAYQLATVYGISEDSSYSIKSIAKDLAVEARRDAKIKISVDNKTKEATKLVAELFKYKQYVKALEALDKLNSDYSHSIKAAVSDLQSVGSGIYWTFFNDNKKESVRR